MRKEQAWKNYGDKFFQLQNIRGRETGINIDTRFMQFKIQRANCIPGQHCQYFQSF